MLAYAASQRSRRRLSPSALLMIAAGHAVAIGLLITAKMDIPLFPKPVITKTTFIPLPPPPAPKPEPRPQVESETVLPPPPISHIDKFPPVIPLPRPADGIDMGPSSSSQVADIGPALAESLPPPTLPPPQPAVVRVGPRAATPADLLRPPYPESMRRTESEAVLRLRLSIDARGRVTAVEPVGTADPAFLSAARSHLTRYWRYRPATEDGNAVASTLTITLRFELEE
ncbi:energy transducer TonB [Sphingomonas glaciei]|uniref:Energy transducer TonB n=1 Tax=Sphingomonas glaciei TaxID=2938948 RepID=A0ABY5MTM3_9SPHN|nr:energy transducer TonB [Sphingomonas glaciei]UUR07319.1 energy transducer TonB [Sphingomonas glaciei]